MVQKHWTPPPALTENSVFAPPGGGRRLRVLRQTAAGDPVLGSQLLRRVRQRRRHDERGRNPDVLLPGMTQSSAVPPTGTVLGQRQQQQV